MSAWESRVDRSVGEGGHGRRLWECYRQNKEKGNRVKDNRT